MEKPILVKRLDNRISATGVAYAFGEYLCSCGNKFTAFACNIRSGHTKSCGCLVHKKRQYKSRETKKSNTFIKNDSYTLLVITKKNGQKIYSKIDEGMVNKISRYGWCASSHGYVTASIRKKTVTLHRFLLNPKGGQFVDHINRDRLDNRLSNLRICTPQENQRNRKSVGFSFDKSRQKYIVSLKVDGHTKHIGRFKTTQEALVARIKAEKKYFKHFALKRSPIEASSNR